jgi:ABC-type oligopeptide transport system ATPase subunit
MDPVLLADLQSILGVSQQELQNQLHAARTVLPDEVMGAAAAQFAREVLPQVEQQQLDEILNVNNLQAVAENVINNIVHGLNLNQVQDRERELNKQDRDEIRKQELASMEATAQQAQQQREQLEQQQRQWQERQAELQKMQQLAIRKG